MGMDRKIERKKWPPKRIITLASMGAFVGFVGYLLIFKVTKSTLNVNAERLTISTVTKGPFQEFIAVMGNAEPERFRELAKDDLIAKHEFELAEDLYQYLQKRKELTFESQKNDLKFRQGQMDALEASLNRMQDNLDVVEECMSSNDSDIPLSDDFALSCYL